MKKTIIKYVGLFALGLFFMGAGCDDIGNLGDESSSDTTVTTTYNVEEGGKVAVYNVGGDIVGCYDLDLNGSECTVETVFEQTIYEPIVRDDTV